MIMVEIDADEYTEQEFAVLIEHVLDMHPYQYTVSIQGTS